MLVAGGLSVYASDARINSFSADSVECKRNTAFYKTYAKSKNYKDAYVFWKKVYDNCPDYSKDTYVLGATILKAKINSAGSEAEKMTYAKELMDMYDARIKYFGDDPKYGIDYILGSKIADYVAYYGNNADYSKVYESLKPIVAEKKEKTDVLALYYFTYSSLMNMVKNPEHKAQYVKDQLMVDEYYDINIEAAKNSGNDSKLKAYQDYKATGEGLFASSGAASCDVMERIYAPQIEEKKTDKEFLKSVVSLLNKVRCTESDMYFAAADYLYALEPSASAALGIAQKAYKEKDFDRATKFYNDALKLSDNADEKADIYYNMAVMAYERRSYGQARTYCNQAMSERSGFGAPMLLIAQMYAATAGSIYPDDAVKQRIVYCLVVDKAARAKAIDPSIASEANKLIGTYSNHYPAKEDVFMHPDLKEGASFTVGGWIGETTTIRTK